MDRLSVLEHIDLQRATDARRDRWLVPLLLVLGMTTGAALFGAGMYIASHIPARCAPVAAPRA